MKVLMVVPASMDASGEEKYSVLIEREILFIESGDIQVKKVFLRSRSNLISVYKFSRTISDIVSDYEPDIIHVQTGTAAYFLLFKSFNIPVVITLGGSDILGYSGNSLLWQIRGYIAKSLSKIACIRADRVVAVSENLYNLLSKNIKRKTWIVPRAIQSDFFVPVLLERARDKLGWELKEKYVVFSNPRPHMKVKNIGLAKEVVDLARENLGREINFEVIYDKSPETVHLMLNAADVLLVTSFHEGSPNIVKEAMACNLPIVSVPCGDVLDRLKEDEYSFVDEYDASELAKSLCKVLERSSRSNGREQVKKQELTERHFKLKVTELYKSVTGKNH